MVQGLTESQCKPFSSRSSTYKFVSNLVVIKLFSLLKHLKIPPSQRVVNYQGKMIALMVPYKSHTFYLPCFPSTNKEVEDVTTMKWIDDKGLWNDYKSTVDFLKHVYLLSDKKIPCKPKFRIVENGMIVGLLTITNQFVQINPPIQNIEKEFPEMKSSNYILADKEITSNTSNETDTMHKNVKYIYLENQFYNAFRTTMRIFIQLYKNRHIVEKMHQVCFTQNVSLTKKRRKMEKYLREIGTEDISFQKYDDEVLLKLHDIFTCENNADNKTYCLVKDGPMNGTLLIPDRHLLTQEDNDYIYYTRLADELVRHRRVHLFMFYPDQYLNINNQDYQILPDEFIIQKNLLNSDYFKELKVHTYQNYARNVPFEHAEPQKTLVREPVRWIEEYEKNKSP